MASRSGEITLQDLLAWEPQLHAQHGLSNGASGDEPLSNDVEWVVTARASAPMLPALRGGELVLLPQRVVIESGVPFSMLLHELAGRPVAGVLTDIRIDPTLDIPLPVLTVASITSDLESEINRLLTSKRGDLLRTGADLEHIISEYLARNARPTELIEAISHRLAIGITIATENGTVIFSTRDHDTPALPTSLTTPASRVGHNGAHATLRHGDPTWVHHALRGDRALWFGPIVPANQALGRLVVRQVVDGVQRAFDQDDATAPRGAARTRVLNDLLLQAPSDPNSIEAAALRAGLPIGAQFRVVMHPAELPEETVYRRLSALGTIHDAGMVDGFTTRIVTSQIARTATTVSRTSLPQGGRSWLAMSAPMTSPRQLPEATRQARFIAGLAERDLLTGPELRFDDDAVLGAYALLFDRWGSVSLSRYVDQLIGDLLREDRRGLLRETLRVYLEHGGAQRSTSDRLAIHRNTLTYRLRQIREVLHLDPDDPNARLGLHLAILAAELPPAPPAQP
ncbi:MAG: helix-turn-helix domain-containing protein [Thermomicrobiales bacterium]